MKANQKGFSIVEILIAVVVIGLLGTIGWLVYNKNYDKPAKSNTTATTPTESTEKNTAITTKPTVAAPVKTTYSKVPADLQVAIVAQLNKDVPACVKNNQPVDHQGKADDPLVDYDVSGFAGAEIGCDGGSWGIFAKIEGSWMFLAKTQMAFNCNLLNQYHYPKQLLALNTPNPECFDNSNSLQPYKGQ